MPPLLFKLVFDQDRHESRALAHQRDCTAHRRARCTIRFIGPNLKRHLDYMEAELDAHPWFAGEQFTAADVQMSFPLEAAAVARAA